MSVATALPQSQANPTGYQDGDMALLPCSTLVAAPWGNFRKTRSSEGKASLVSSIREQGVIQPIVVRPVAGAFGQFEVLAGYGRWEACQELELPTIPCVVRVCDDKTAMAVMLAENAEREDMGPVDEAEAAEVILSECKGDEKEAAAMLGWTVFKLRQRMRLMLCPKEIRDLIGVRQESGFTLTLSHADELAAFPMDVQHKLIVKVVQEKMRPEDLKHLLLNGKRKLERACFDKSECGQCQFNSDQQASLFSAPSAEAICSNISCFNKKTQTHLEQQRSELEERYGKVLLWGAVSEEHRRPLLERAVGSEQYNNGCTSCQNRVAVLDDRPGSEGKVFENQCIDLPCYRQRVADFKAATAPAPQATTEQSCSAEASSTAVQQSTAAPVRQPTQPKPVTAELPSRIKQDNDSVMRQAAADVLMESDTFLLAAMLVSLCHTSGYRNKDLGINGSLQANLLAAMTLTNEQLNTAMVNAVEHMARKSDANGAADMVQLMKNAALTQQAQTLKDATVQRWEMNEDRLSLFTKDMQIAMLKESGFADAYIKAHDQKQFTTLISMKTTERQKAILAFPFDWSGYAPGHLLSNWDREKF